MTKRKKSVQGASYFKRKFKIFLLWKPKQILNLQNFLTYAKYSLYNLDSLLCLFGQNHGDS